MPIPLIWIPIAVSSIVGAGSAVSGGKKMKKAKEVSKSAGEEMEESVILFQRRQESTVALLDEIGKQELDILQSFSEFSELLEQISGRPEFEECCKKGVDLPELQLEDIKGVSVRAAALLGGLGGAVAGTAGGIAASGAATSAVMALGTASTGTAISSLSGAAATKTTLAALGGGSLATGGGGVALGTAVLGGINISAALLVGGIIFNISGKKMLKTANKELESIREVQFDIDKISEYLRSLNGFSKYFKETLEKVDSAYRVRLERLRNIISFAERTNWSEYSAKEKIMIEDLILLVGLLYKMCQTELVLQSKTEKGLNLVNKPGIKQRLVEADKCLRGLEAV